MQINTLLAAGLFDSQWIVPVIVMVGALVSWLSKRREEKRAGSRPEADAPSPSPGNAPGDLSLEEILRRLMGEEPPAPVRSPPPIPDAAGKELPPVPDWQEGKPWPPAGQTTPPLRPPPVTAAQAAITTTGAGEPQEQAARRFKELTEQGRHPATVASHRRGHRSTAGNRAAARWRDPRSARQAFLASIVFAPPKSIEP